MDSHLGIRGTFSPSLRNRSIWNVIEPVLTASSGILEGQLRPSESSRLFLITWSIEERALQTSDFTFWQETSNQSLQVLLLFPSSLESHSKQNTILQLRQFVTSDLSSCPRKAIAFLLSEGRFASASEKYSLNGLLALQVLYGLYT
ncbi:hypothetical protein BDW59DRAFT_139928 [Aspergillus cavernicola]|uniref:Uncharacterized protein n=1 Tax=Aspergillus cavernicola TaxID=176166 RepID=A0ABR4IY30_9EURO